MGLIDWLKDISEPLIEFISDEPEGGMIPPNAEEMPDITHLNKISEYETQTINTKTKTKIIYGGYKSIDKKINELDVDIIDIKVLSEDKVLVMYKEG